MLLFDELREELEKHCSDGEFVIQKMRGRGLDYQFQKIAVKAGLGIIDRPFDNMRMSRSNEILRRFGSQKESLWIGHTSEVMGKHYFQLSDDDFTEAAG